MFSDIFSCIEQWDEGNNPNALEKPCKLNNKQDVSDDELHLTNNEIRKLVRMFDLADSPQSVLKCLTLASRCNDDRPAKASLLVAIRYAIVSYDDITDSGIPIVMSILARYRRRPDVSLLVCCILLCFLQNSTNASILEKYNIEHEICQTMKEHGGIEVVCEWWIIMITVLCKLNSSASSKFASHGTCHLLATMLKFKAFPDITGTCVGHNNERYLESCCECIATICMQNRENYSTFVSLQLSDTLRMLLGQEREQGYQSSTSAQTDQRFTSSAPLLPMGIQTSSDIAGSNTAIQRLDEYFCQMKSRQEIDKEVVDKSCAVRYICGKSSYFYHNDVLKNSHDGSIDTIACNNGLSSSVLEQKECLHRIVGEDASSSVVVSKRMLMEVQ